MKRRSIFKLPLACLGLKSAPEKIKGTVVISCKDNSEALRRILKKNPDIVLNAINRSIPQIKRLIQR